jgi:hypothetical protein
MKKTLLGVVIVGAAVVLSGCGKAPAVQNQNQTQQNASPKSSVISSIKDAMGLGTKMKCEYFMGTGTDAVKSTAYIEGKKYMSTGVFNGVTSYTIFDGETMYNWQAGQKTGFKMTMTCLNDLRASLPADQQANPGAKAPSPEDQFDNAINASCSPNTENIDFSVPADITFNDQCEMMKKTTEMMKNIKVPGGAGSVPANIPNMPKLPTQ